MSRQQLQSLLDEIEEEMRRLDVWSDVPPDATAFDSQLPFFLDTMPLDQWVQWVFVARFRALLDGNLALPAQCGVAPVLEEYCQTNAVQGEHWVALVQQFDRLVTAGLG